MKKFYFTRIISVCSTSLWEKGRSESGSIPLTNGSGSGRPKNIRIRIPGTGFYTLILLMIDKVGVLLQVGCTLFVTWWFWCRTGSWTWTSCVSSRLPRLSSLSHPQVFLDILVKKLSNVKFVYAYHCNFKCTLFPLLLVGIVPYWCRSGSKSHFLFNADPDLATYLDQAKYFRFDRIRIPDTASFWDHRCSQEEPQNKVTTNKKCIGDLMCHASVHILVLMCAKSFYLVYAGNSTILNRTFTLYSFYGTAFLTPLEWIFTICF